MTCKMPAWVTNPMYHAACGADCRLLEKSQRKDYVGMKRVEVPSYPVSIFVAGANPCQVVQDFCDEVGLCVTMTRTSYLFTAGSQDGWAIGLINYPRFPAEPGEIFAKAEALAVRIIESYRGIESATVQAQDKTVWFSARAEDNS